MLNTALRVQHPYRFPAPLLALNLFAMSYLFTSESVSEGHPDKVADQISDALVDHFIAFDAESKVACETLVTTGKWSSLAR